METQKINYSPKQNYLLCEAMEDSAVSRGGIIIPHTARVKLNMGKIKEKGPLCDDSTQIEEIVMFAQHSEYRVMIDNLEIILIKDSDILCGDCCSTPVPSVNQCEVCGYDKCQCKRRPLGRDFLTLGKDTKDNL